MKWRRILGPVLALLVVGEALLACCSPEVQLVAGEMQCCQQMAGDCAPNPAMPAGHSCRTSMARPQKDFLPSASGSIAAPRWDASGLVLAAAVPEVESFDWNYPPATNTHGPPQYALDVSVPLRI